jgi:drug/metabolite transporter (DMT)-like permease
MAYSNRGVLTVWGIAWGALLFSERINVATVAAMALILAGIALIGGENE